MAVIFIFIDGVGLGQSAPENPFSQNRYSSFEVLTDGFFNQEAKAIANSDQLFKPIDANLGVEGLPQSGTGQTALFTGRNASKEIGKHFGPFPHSGIKPFLKKESIFHAAQEAGKRPYFMNAYPPVFFNHAKKRNRWSCTTLMTKSASMKLNSTEDVLDETALTAEIVQNAWREKLGIDIPKITPTDAGLRLLDVAEDYDLLLYEYYLTDKAGHSQKKDQAERVLKPLDEFLMHIIKHKKSSDTLVITSDHGNLEDLSTKTHTRNKVPLFVLGESAQKFQQVESLTDVKDGIMGVL
ncbi:alkaline phosphatase family protein [Gracilimonas mengyeensis]|uniref:Phosphoglycerate mutase n=1 Tax=Gracilimonas mengyeensis TaxID=1302730 RepID=A0A521CNY0_9BACT|nr:alkaline phosphatase family protein [Gracilimonas mengyeensis]SMO61157.1 phosphoglycerate mutase [Gracilimonas mengyeensis]